MRNSVYFVWGGHLIRRNTSAVNLSYFLGSIVLKIHVTDEPRPPPLLGCMVSHLHVLFQDIAFKQLVLVVKERNKTCLKIHL